MLHCMNVNSCTGMIGLFIFDKLLYRSIESVIFPKCSFSFLFPLVELLVNTLYYFFPEIPAQYII